MTPTEHKAEAETILRTFEYRAKSGADMIALAQVHATLALLEETAGSKPDPWDLPLSKTGSSPTETRPSYCSEALILKGEHFFCDRTPGHDLPHGSAAIEAVWGDAT